MAEKPNKGGKTKVKNLSVAFVGSGRLASYLAVVLHECGYRISEIIARDTPHSRRAARVLAAKVGAKAVTISSAALQTTLLWFAIPDGEIANAAREISKRLTELQRKNLKSTFRFAFHSSGALSSRELTTLRAHGIAIASTHPLMTFVAGSAPALQGVPFALEGDAAAVRLARGVVRSLGAESFEIHPSCKPAYHAWATMTSPLLLAFLVTLEEAASAAGLSKADARRKSLPIIRQTIANYSQLGPAASFSGPLIRGDAATIAKHLSAFRKNPGVRQVYLALAQAALRGLLVKNRKELQRLLKK